MNKCFFRRQDDGTVNQHTKEFYQLQSCIDLMESSEAQQIARFVGGLWDDILDRVSLQTTSHLTETLNLAEHVESQLEKLYQEGIINRVFSELEFMEGDNHSNKHHPRPCH